MGEVIIAAILGPALLLVLGLLIDLARARFMKTADPLPAVPVGQAVDLAAAAGAWAERAYEALLAQLRDEEADHRIERERHSRCDQTLRDHGIRIPHD